ncbi:YybS family protein [Brevibacillus humidisoli]|uniref:DUF2232 domain-containing protein n=1 Tax=Brevibacillus humidisoli TaxID=2895522 RepID=UPI001E491126|nr:DUF2232 domain-containing protein [Brevibacillus humidisoli]UFJ40427.1 YybS family protein [Brevibacillus humidisoli]
MPNRTRQLAENALMLGISAVLLFLGTYTFISGIALTVVPVPFILLAVRRSIRDMLLIVGTFAILGLILAGLGGILSAFFMGLAGTTMGILYKKRGTAFAAVVGGAGAFLVSTVVSLAISTFVMGIDITTELRQASERLINGELPFPLPPGMTEEQWKQEIQLQVALILSLLPFLFVMASFMMSIINHWLARVVSKRLARPLPALKPFREWSFPRSLLYYYFLSLLLLLFFRGAMEDTYWGDAILNVKVMLDVVFAIQGLSFCLLFLSLKNWKWVTPVLIVSLFIFPLLTNILSLIGIFDLGVGLRKRLETRK